MVPPRTDRVRATPPAPLVVGVEERAGVRFAAPGDAEAVLVLTSRRGVPAAGGLFAVAVDIMCVYCLCEI